MKIKRPLLWVCIILIIVVIAYCSIYTGGMMMAPRMQEDIMKKVSLILIILLTFACTAFADDFCNNQWPNSLQMRDYCEDRQQRYIYLTTTAYALLKTDAISIQKMNHCILMYQTDVSADWELVYLCIMSTD